VPVDLLGPTLARRDFLNSPHNFFSQILADSVFHHLSFLTGDEPSVCRKFLSSQLLVSSGDISGLVWSTSITSAAVVSLSHLYRALKGGSRVTIVLTLPLICKVVPPSNGFHARSTFPCSLVTLALPSSPSPRSRLSPSSPFAVLSEERVALPWRAFLPFLRGGARSRCA